MLSLMHTACAFACVGIMAEHEGAQSSQHDEYGTGEGAWPRCYVMREDIVVADASRLQNVEQ
jgi:hypothetical protein